MLAVRFPDDVIQRVEELAKQEGRSKSQVIIRALQGSLFPIETRKINQKVEPIPDWEVVEDKPLEYISERVKVADKLHALAGMCVHGREAKFCIHCKLKG